LDANGRLNDIILRSLHNQGIMPWGMVMSLLLLMTSDDFH
jgi:hypothetical protein